jgi:hypothetical protein
MLLNTAYLFGQECSKIGYVEDEVGNPVEFVSIFISSEKDSIRFGSITDKDGKFKFDIRCSVSYSIKLRYLGYNEIEDTIRIDHKDDFIKTYRLIPSSVQLNETSIVFKRPTIERMADRLIYFVDTSLIQGNQSAYED